MEIDECLPRPCENGGTCTDLVNGYHCNCSSEFSVRLIFMSIIMFLNAIIIIILTRAKKISYVTLCPLDIFRVKTVRQISTVVAPIRVQMVAPVRTFQMISGAAVLQGSQDWTAQLKLTGVSFLPAYMETAL